MLLKNAGRDQKEVGLATGPDFFLRHIMTKDHYLQN